MDHDHLVHTRGGDYPVQVGQDPAGDARIVLNTYTTDNLMSHRPNCVMDNSPTAPPPSYDTLLPDIVTTTESPVTTWDERQPLLTLDRVSHHEQRKNIYYAVIWAFFAGLCWAGSHLLLKNVALDFVDVTFVASLVQIVTAGSFVTCCQFQRLWPKRARNRHKIFLVLYAFLSAVAAVAAVYAFTVLVSADAHFMSTLIIFAVLFWSLVIIREPIRLWKLGFTCLLMAAVIVIVRPPMIFDKFNPHHNHAHDDHQHPLSPTITMGWIATVVGVAVCGGLSVVCIEGAGVGVANGVLMFYGGWGGVLVSVLASRCDPDQKIISNLITVIPIIDWILMASNGLMISIGNVVYMNAVKAYTPNIAVGVATTSYVIVAYAVQAILKQEIPETLTIIGLAAAVFALIALCCEQAISNRLPFVLQKIF